MWWIFALLSALFAALTAIFVKAGVKNIDTNLATAIRTVIILFITWIVVFATGGIKTISTLTKDNYMFLILSGITTAGSWIFYFLALQKGTVSQVAPIDKVSVPLAIIMAVMFLGEQLTFKTIIGSLLIIIGTIFIIL